MRNFTIPRNDKKQEETGIQFSAQAITAFIALTGLTAIIINQLKINDFNTITMLLILLFLVLIYGFWGKTIWRKITIYQENKKQNKLAKKHFETFKKLVFQFKEFTEDHHDNIQCVMGDLKNNSGITEFSQLKVVSSLIIQDSYNYYIKHLETFNKITKVSLWALAEQFESILNTYYMLYVEESAKSVKDIRTPNIQDIPKKYKEQYNNARLKYIGFREDYKKFAMSANKDLKEDNGRGLKDYFIYPDEL